MTMNFSIRTQNRKKFEKYMDVNLLKGIKHKTV